VVFEFAAFHAIAASHAQGRCLPAAQHRHAELLLKPMLVLPQLQTGGEGVQLHSKRFYPVLGKEGLYPCRDTVTVAIVRMILHSCCPPGNIVPGLLLLTALIPSDLLVVAQPNNCVNANCRRQPLCRHQCVAEEAGQPIADILRLTLRSTRTMLAMTMQLYPMLKQVVRRICC
jgi:hypothetical protein